MSRKEPNGPMPRMTDSQAGPGGPSSLKFAALSVQSYHLDSPPFTGAAVGAGGPLDEVGRKDDHDLNDTFHPSANRKNSSSSPTANGAALGMAHEAEDPYTRSLSHTTASKSYSSNRENTLANYQGRSLDVHTNYSSTSTTRSRQVTADGDVPNWNLDGQAHSRQNSAASLATLGPSKGLQPLASFRSTASAADKTAAQTSAHRDTSPSKRTTARTPSKQPSSHSSHDSEDRPAYTQFPEEVDGQEDAASSAAERDDDVDGDEGLAFNGAKSRPGEVPRQGQTKEDYRFPRHRLPTRMRDDTKIPLVIVACGSFSPPTYLHLRIFEMSKDQILESGKYELLGGYYSPVSDYYKKEGLAKATHRVRMCELAVEKTSTWLMVDAWESLQDEYQRTAVVLDHFDEEINGGAKGGVLLNDGSRRKVKIMLLAGGDLIQSMGEPGVWAPADLHHILGKYGCLIVERTGADVWSFLLSHDLLWKYRRNLKIVKQTIYNDISSSKVRLFVRRGQSIKYLLPNSVIHYIEKEGLYRLLEEDNQYQDSQFGVEDTNNW